MKRPIYLTLASVMAFFAVMSLMLALSSFTYALEEPPLDCKGEHVIAINAEIVYLFPDSLVNGREFGVTLQLRRMSDSYIVASDTLPSDSITIGCADVGKTLMIEVIASADGMSTSCMVEVTVQNKLPINLIERLPNIEMSCQEFKDLNGNYSSLGTYVDDEADREDRSFGDFDFRDGLVERVCDELTIRTVVLDSTNCGFGKIIRRFIIKAPGLEDSLVLDQCLTIYNENPFNIEDIYLARDTTVMGCFKGTLPADLGGKPQFNLLGKCAMVLANKNDMVFNDPTSGCPFVMRTWKIMDMCTYTPDMQNGYWEIVQNIYIMDTIAPKFETLCKDTTIINYNGACTIPVSLSAKATDNCTNNEDLAYSYKVTQGGNLILQGNTPSFNLNFTEGIFDVVWTVDDRCGNTSQCIYKLRTKEGKKPTPVLIPGIVANLPMACDVKIDADLFNKGSYDNCTPKDELIFSFSEDIEDDTLTFGCADLGIQNVTVFVTDKAGNQNSVTVTIEIQDLEGHCPSNTKQVSISGQILTEEAMAVSDVEVRLEGAEQSRMVKSDDFGRFEIGDLAMYSDYELRARRETDFKAGVNVLDLLAIQRHLLGISRISNGYRMIAADVDGSEKIDLKDLTELRKLVLGVKAPDQSVHSWRFIPNTTKNASTDPWPLIDLAYYKNLENDIFLDFKAIKTGDVDGSISQTLKSRNNEAIVWNLDDRTFTQGEEVEIAINLADQRSIQALQVQLHTESHLLEFIGVREPEMAGAFHAQGSYVNLMIFDQKGIDLSGDKPLAHLKFKAIKSGKLSEALAISEENMEAMVVDRGGQAHDLHLNVIQKTENVLLVRQNAPNPFGDHTMVNFEVGLDLPVEISVYDQSGKLLYHNYDQYTKGKHQLYLDDTQLKGASGILLLHVETAEVSEIRKLLRIR